MEHRTLSSGRTARLRGSVSLATLALLGFAAPAFAQTAAPAADTAASTSADDNGKEVVVVGVRAALQSAQNIKRNADTVVDSITATDIGAFPDKSVSEALQRVPGITVNRLQSNDDSTHPSGEPTQVLVRGLTQVRTEFNGRDSFSADAARGLEFNDVSPELVARVDAYKNQTADMIEGGIAGTVDIRTRLPFDSKGLVVSGDVQGDYGDKSKKKTGEYSGLISDTWDTDAGKFGLLFDYAYSHVVTRTESVIMDKIDLYCSGGATNPDGTAIIGSGGTIPCTSNPFGGSGWAFIPDGVRFSQVDYDRTRHGISAAAQYEDPTGHLHATVQYTSSKYHNAWFERASHTIFDGTYYGSSAFRVRSSSILNPAPGTGAFTFAPNGMITGGTFAQPEGDWRGGSAQDYMDDGSAVAGQPFVNYCVGAQPGCSSNLEGLHLQNESRDFDHREGTQDISGNVKWDISSRLHLNLDYQHIWASVRNDDNLVATGTMANDQYSVNSDGTPQVKLLPGTNVNYAAGGLSNPHNYWIPFIQAHEEHDNAKEDAIRGDLSFDFGDGGWFNSLNVGVRYADRSQQVRYSTFNWTPIAAPWNCNGPGFNIDNTTSAPYPAACGHAGNFNGYGAGIWQATSLGNNFYANGVYPNGALVYLNRATLSDPTALAKALSGATTNSPIAPGWSPICGRPGATIEGCYLPSEVEDVTERTKAAYAELKFGGNDKYIFGGVSLVGNLGVRVISTTDISSGSVSFPASNLIAQLQGVPCGTPLAPNSVVNPACYLTQAIIDFSNGGGTPNDIRASHTNVLPSLNLRFGLSDKDYIRFGASRALSRPDFGLLRNFVQINAPLIDTTPSSPYVVYNSPTAAHTAANVTGYNFVFNAESGYGALKPITADQFDLTYERYMGHSSSISADVFYKKLNGSIAYGEFTRTFTNNGATETVNMRGPRNENGGGKLTGFEISYQTYFDFLPGLLSGLGTQLNYTYVHQSGINNSNLVTEGALAAGGTGAYGSGLTATGDNGDVIDSHKLAGISKSSFNIVALYEKGPVGLRVAYNWRSRFLTDNLDCCIGLPVFQKAAGYLDASIRFQVNKWLELSAQGSNLLNTKLEYQQQIFGDSPATPGAKPVYMDSGWSRVDRRYQLGARVKF